MDRWWARAAIGVTVLSLHAAALDNVLRKESRNSPHSVEETPVTEAEIIEAAEESDKIPAPDVQFVSVPVEFPGLRQVEFDDWFKTSWRRL